MAFFCTANRFDTSLSDALAPLAGSEGGSDREFTLVGMIGCDMGMNKFVMMLLFSILRRNSNNFHVF